MMQVEEEREQHGGQFEGSGGVEKQFNELNQRHAYSTKRLVISKWKEKLR